MAMEAARIGDRAIATTKRPRRWLLAVAISVVLVIAGKPTAPPGNIYRHGEPEVGGYAAAIISVGIMTTPTIMTA